MSPLDARLGAVIRQRRTASGLSQDALAKRIGLTFQQIQKYESGKNQVTFTRLVALADALRTTVADLAGAAQGSEEAEIGEASDRETLELVKRFAALPEHQRRGVRLLVQSLAGAA